jgi:Holliday junction resolvasome RuvABC DNA-binding subunit
VARSEGGDHSQENLLCLCESHHIAQHAGSLIVTGTATNATITRRAHNSFTLAERAVETASALKSLGFDRHEVKRAMERTRAHVGTAELSLDQWIRIALSYCPKPT